jgi:hypothetical protein
MNNTVIKFSHQSTKQCGQTNNTKLALNILIITIFINKIIILHLIYSHIEKKVTKLIIRVVIVN